MLVKKWTFVIVALVVLAISLPFLATIFAVVMEGLRQVAISLAEVAQ